MRACARPWCSSPMTSTKPCCSRTKSPCCPRARWYRRARLKRSDARRRPNLSRVSSACLQRRHLDGMVKKSQKARVKSQKSKGLPSSFTFAFCLLPFAFCLSFSSPARAAEAPTVVVGAKKFTEGAILAELMAQVLEQHAGVQVTRQLNLAGTKVAFEALRAGGIDAYAEYTGTG